MVGYEPLQLGCELLWEQLGSSWGASTTAPPQAGEVSERGNYSRLGSERVQVAVVGMDSWVVVLAERFPTGYGLWL